MFLRQALPKDMQSSSKPLYSIKRRASPSQKNSARSVQSSQDMEKEPAELRMKDVEVHRVREPALKDSVMREPTRQTLHRINSKDKPDMTSAQRSSKLIMPKSNSSLGLKPIHQPCDRAQERRFATPVKASPLKRLRQSTERMKSRSKEVILCKMENKVVTYVQTGFSYSDLSAIDPLHWLCYEGQTSGHGVRNGFGTQFFSNGEKFVGMFSLDQACGQGTYYGLSKRTMGSWEGNLLKQVYIQL